METNTALIYLILIIAGYFLGFYFNQKIGKNKLTLAESNSKKIITEAEKMPR